MALACWVVLAGGIIWDVSGARIDPGCSFWSERGIFFKSEPPDVLSRNQQKNQPACQRIIHV